MLGEPSGGLPAEEHATYEKDCGCSLDGERDDPGAVTGQVKFGAVVDPEIESALIVNC